MNEIASHFRKAKNNINWSREALDEFDIATRQFVGPDHFRFLTEFDSDTGENCVKYKMHGLRPSVLERKVTEALLSTRNAFDQALYGACCAIGKTPRTDHLYFPWASSPNDLNGRLRAVDKKTKTTLYPNELWSALTGLEPYPRSDKHAGGNDLVKELSQIANRKHTVGLTYGINVSELRYPDFTGSGPMKMPYPFWDSVKNEVVVLRYTGNVNLHNNGRIAFYIALDEPGVFKSIPISSALRHYAAYAERVCKVLEDQVVSLSK